MNGAESLVRTLVASGVDICFTNPGTSEMHFVAALDRVDGMRCVLGLFEGSMTGAADGYSRMKGPRPPPCCISAPASPTAWRICTMPRRPFRHRQHRRRARDLPPATIRRSPRTSTAWRGRFVVRVDLAGRGGSPPTAAAGSPQPKRAAADRHGHPAGGCGLERGRRLRAAAGATPARQVVPRGRGGRRQDAAQRAARQRLLYDRSAPPEHGLALAAQTRARPAAR